MDRALSMDRTLGALSLAVATGALVVALRRRGRKEEECYVHPDFAANEAAVVAKLEKVGLVAVVAVAEAEKAVPMAEALVAGGLFVVEVMFRTPASEEAVRRIAAKVPHATLGGGTILSVEQAERAVKAGAQFIVAPGFNPDVVRWCKANAVPVFPGVATASEVSAAMQLGLKYLKFFPAEGNGGTTALQLLWEAYASAGVKFMPTGGLTEKNFTSYLSMHAVFAAGGVWMVPDKAMQDGDMQQIRELARKASETVKQCQSSKK